MIGELGMLGVPSSAAAHGPGQERAPAALRAAGLPQRLSEAGLAVDEAMTCLAVFARHQGLAGLVITEFNPDHGAEDGSTADALARGLAGALAGRPAPGRDEE